MKCYMCDEPATSVEHAPAKCFFPKGYRKDLITVPSCAIHNNETSKDDEYVRGIIVSCSGNNSIALTHWRGSVRSGYLHSPKLFLKTFSKQIDSSFFHDRKRVDDVIIKISHAVYFKEYKKRWQSYPTPFYYNFLFDDGKADIHERLPNYKDIPVWHIFEGANQSVFKYQFFDGKVDGHSNCILRMIFYEGFEVIVIPRSEKLELDYSYKPEGL
ncbi:hypothetical protein [Pedobacter sp. Leaf170]|uniref:hypothetical protein n=1 Tax=Pedobacter sp. Leaf170 TaxID=2876558 RepID=UPI001E58AD3E|nr:hypothetical protein [Pedobacter sp. Leaf170]